MNRFWPARLFAAMVTLAVPACDASSTQSPSTRAAAAQRIISISPDATEMVGFLGQSSRLVAVSTFCVYPPEVRSLPKVGGLFDTNLELILKLRPDLLILRGDSASVEQLCRDNQIQIYRDRTEGFADIYTTLHELGDLLGCAPRAAQVETEMRRGLDKIAAALAGRARPRVLVTLSRRPDAVGQILTAGRGTFIDEIIARAGGINVFGSASSDYPEVSLEAILAAQPDVIVESMPEMKITPQVETQLRSFWKRLGEMPATKSDRIYILTDENSQIPSPRIVAVVARLARLLHPEVPID